jgi:hypothetical protein
MEMPPFTVRFPVTYTTVNNLRVLGINVCPESMVRFPFTMIQEDVVSLVAVNQSAALKEEIVVFVERVVTS